MKKYFHIIKITMNSMMVYRANLFFTVFGELMSFVAMLYLWKMIFDRNGQAGDYTYSGLAIYYLIAKFISLTVRNQGAAHEISDEIFFGRISNYIVKPFSHMLSKASSYTGTVMFNAIIFSPLVIIITYMFTAESINISLMNIIYFIFYFIVAAVLNFFIYYLLGIFTFYLGNITGAAWLFSHLSAFLSGAIIPLDMMPASWRLLTDWLPFKYLIFVPIQVIRGQYALTELAGMIIIPLFWIVLFYGLALIINFLGLKRYEANGA